MNQQSDLTLSLQARLRDAESTLIKVRQIADGWVGIDAHHHYGNAILLALVGEDTAPFDDFAPANITPEPTS